MAASAQDLTEARREEARGLFEAGRAAFGEGRYEDALDYFERSYAISELPELLYNIGHTADRLREDRRALEAFEAYLAARPETDGRDAIEARIAQLREIVAEEEAREAEARARAEQAEAAARADAEPEPVDVAPAPEPTPSEPSIVGWLIAGGGGAVAIAGAVLLGLAEAEAQTVRDAPPGTPWPEVEGAHANADTFAVVGGVLLGVGAAAASLGVVWGAVELSADTEVAFGPGSVTLRGRL